MHLKILALKVFKGLPVFAQRKVVRTLYPGYVVAAKVYITDPQGRFLAVKTSYADEWDIPSGHCDAGESPDLAASRELFEETGIKVDNMQQCGVIFNPQLRTVQVLFVHQLHEALEPTADTIEITNVKWVTQDDVPLNPYALEAIEVIVNRKVSYWVSDRV